MAAIPIIVAEAITADLKAGVDAGDFVLQFAPEWFFGDWDVGLKDEDLKLLRVVVLPVSRERTIQPEDREPSVEHIVQYDVGVLKKFGDSEGDNDTGRVNRDDVADLVLLVEEIANRKALSALNTTPRAVYDPETPPVVLDYSKADLRVHGMFVGFVRLTYRVSQTL